ncbi:MAG: AMMECR1 domain-containing protein, partial [SAR324 cluster bacterium]|nr:AMMECR1 domain-containing protein [SAR324 cluster bacterium]
SLLEMMEKVNVEDPSQFREKIQLGRDGISLRLKGNSALFLPEVAPEQGWNVENTLRQLCRKAGLEEDDWRDSETEVLCFQTKHLED